MATSVGEMKLKFWVKMLTRKEVPRATGWRVPYNNRLPVLWKMVKTEQLDSGDAERGL